jgi:hypothetical protein
MRNISTSETSLVGLIGHFRDEIKNLIRQEVDLVKTEMSEKMGRFGRNAIWLAAGAVAAFAGLILLLASLSSLISFAFESAGVSRSLAFFLGALIIGGGAVAAGFGLVAKAARTFSSESLAPQKTLHSLKKFNTGSVEEKAAAMQHPLPVKQSSDQIEASIGATRREVGETAEEISHRLRPGYMNHIVKAKIQAHPLRSSLLAVGTGFLSSLMVLRRARHAHS